jgi:hypothetical protein
MGFFGMSFGHYHVLYRDWTGVELAVIASLVLLIVFVVRSRSFSDRSSLP